MKGAMDASLALQYAIVAVAVLLLTCTASSVMCEPKMIASVPVEPKAEM